MIFSLENKVAVVTGGASGIGLAITKLFAQQGAKIHVLELSIEAANKQINDAIESAKNIEIHSCDVSNLAQVEDVMNGIKSIDILVNNAGIAHVGNAENTNELDFDRVINVNVKGVYHCVHAALPLMKANGGGVILNMASVASSVGISDRFAYSMSKGAVRSMTQSIAKDFLKDNIRCNCISPARVHTPFVDGFIAKNFEGKEQETFEKLSKSQPIGRMGTPDEIAYLALYLCSAESGFVTGCDYPIDGGFIYLNN
jgi:NAD(P)-dependent dehydrogenase (short-subunit alcohol dehydrogenase family)